MKPTTIIALLVVLAGCLLYVLLRSAGPDEPSDPFPTVGDVFSPPLGDVTDLTIAPNDGPSLRFRRSDDAWRIVEPISAGADRWAVAGVVDQLTNLEYRREIAPDDSDAPSPEITGIDEPRWTLTVATDDGRTVALHVGNPVPLSSGEQTYVQPADSKTVYVVDVDFADRLRRPLADYRAKDLFDVERDRITRVEIQAARPLTLARTGDDWTLRDPVHAPAQAQAARKLVDALRLARVSEFVTDQPDDLGDFGLAEPRLIARMHVAAPRPQDPNGPASRPAGEPTVHALLLGRVSRQSIYAKLADEPTVFQLPADLADKLQPQLADLRDMTVLPFDPNQVIRVTVRSDKGVAQARLDPNTRQWRLTQPVAGSANDQRVRRLLDDLHALAAASWRDEPTTLTPFGLDQPRATITLHLAGSNETIALAVGAASPSGEMTFIRRQAGASVAVVETESADKLLADPVAFVDPLLARMPAAGKAVALQLDRPDGTFHLHRDPNTGGWALAEPVAAPADANPVNTILDDMESLRATRIIGVGPEAVQRFADADQALTVQVTYRSTVLETPTTQPTTDQASTRPAITQKQQTQVLRVVLQADHAVAWRTDVDSPRIGQFDVSLYQHLSAELREGTLLTPDPNEVSAITFTEDGRQLTLRRTAGRWQAEQDAFVAIAPAKVADYLHGLAEVTTEQFVRSTAPDDPAEFQLDAPPLTVTVTEGDEARTLAVSAKGPAGRAARYATLTGTPGVFLLAEDDLARLRLTIGDVKQ